MSKTIDQLIDEIILREGGLVDHPNDRGKITKYGITLKTLSGWLGKPASADAIRNLEVETARKIYLSLYVERPKFNQIVDPQLRALVADFGVHSGTATATKQLQKVLKVPADGILGPKTLEALDAADPITVYYAYFKTRVLFLIDIILSDPTQISFLKGWIGNRMMEFVRYE